MKKSFFAVCFCALSLFAAGEDRAGSERPLVNSVSARLVGEKKIKVTWALPEPFPAVSLVLYASHTPVSQKSDLDTARAVAELASDQTSYLFTADEFADFYFAVVAKTQSQQLYPLLIPSVNVTATPVRTVDLSGTVTAAAQKPAREYPAGHMRNIPLPYLDLLDDLDRKPTALDPQVIQAGRELAGAGKPVQRLAPYTFEKDTVQTQSGDGYFLYDVLTATFFKAQYPGAITELKRFLSVNREQAVANRAFFYLGEAYYFCGDYEQALTQFLRVEQDFPALSRKWIDSTLDLYEP